MFGRGTTGVLGLAKTAAEQQSALPAPAPPATDTPAADAVEAAEAARWVLNDQLVPRPLLWPTALGAATCAVQLAVGQHHTAVLTADGRVVTWGMNRFGQCGRPAEQLTRVLTPPSSSNTFHYRVEFMPPGVLPVPPDVSVTKLVAGFYHTALLTADGQCFVCGPTTHEPSRPLAEYRTRDVSFGWRHAMAVVDRSDTTK